MKTSMKYFLIVSVRAWMLVGIFGICAEYLQSGYVTMLFSLWLPFIIGSVAGIISLSLKPKI